MRSSDPRPLSSQPLGRKESEISTAYFIVLNTEDPGFDVFVNGKHLAKHAREIDAIARKLGLKPIDAYVSQDLAAVADEFEEPGNDDAIWFDPGEGVSWSSQLQDHLESHPNSATNVSGLLADLAEFHQVFMNADAAGLKWHLQVDF